MNFALVTGAEYWRLLIPGKSGSAPDDIAKLSKVKAKLKLIGDHVDMEKVRDFLKDLT